MSVTTPPGTVGPGANASLSPFGAPFAGGAALPVYTLHPGQQTGAVAVYSANSTIYHRNLGGSALISQIGVYVSASSGNVCAAVYSSPGGRNPPAARIATSGPVPCPAGGWATIALQGGPVAVDTTTYLALAADNATATFYAAGTLWSATPPLTGMAAGLSYGDASGASFPCPATPNIFAPLRGVIIGLYGI
jgi:hypothetical protein